MMIIKMIDCFINLLFRMVQLTIFMKFFYQFFIFYSKFLLSQNHQIGTQNDDKNIL